jgi:23S rRNA pseudouridine1911/1915/1917 synthase
VGLVVHPAGGHAHGTLVNGLLHRYPEIADVGDPARPGIVHRLDRDTSGLLVLARDEATHAALQQALRERKITREYLALVEGRPPARRGTIDAPLGRDRRVRTRISTDTDDPHHAVTHFETERALPADTLLRVRLETGRMHQIRVHLAAIDLPVVGDPVYGRSDAALGRQFLHAAELAFPHPVSGERLELRSELPSDLASYLVVNQHTL